MEITDYHEHEENVHNVKEKVSDDSVTDTDMEVIDQEKTTTETDVKMTGDEEDGTHVVNENQDVVDSGTVDQGETVTDTKTGSEEFESGDKVPLPL